MPSAVPLSTTQTARAQRGGHFGAMTRSRLRLVLESGFERRVGGEAQFVDTPVGRRMPSF